MPNSGESTANLHVFVAVTLDASHVVDVVVLEPKFEAWFVAWLAKLSSAIVLVVLHNLDSIARQRRDVVYVRVAMDNLTASMPFTSSRFVALEAFLRSRSWDCAYSVDLSDVEVSRVPPCHALDQQLVMSRLGRRARAGGR